MNLSLGLTIDGREALVAALQRLPEKVRRNELLKILRKAAVPIQGRASELAPIDPKLPVHLKDWIAIAPQPAFTYDAEAAVAVGPSPKVFWGLFLEFGYGPIRTPRPFLRPAFDYGTDLALGVIRAGLDELLEKATEGKGAFKGGDA